MTAETTRIWMYENRDRWNEYQRNWYKRNKDKVRGYQLKSRMRCATQESAESAGPADTGQTNLKTDA